MVSPLTNPHHSLLSCTILLAYLTSKALFLKHSFTVSSHLFHGLPTEQLLAHSLSNPITLHSLHMAVPMENTFINLFVYPLHHSAQLPYPCIWLIPSNPLRLSISKTLTLDLSFSFHNIVSLSYIIGKNNVSCKTLAHSAANP